MDVIDHMRRPERVPVDIPVVITTILSSSDATLVNLTEGGALISGASVPKGMQLQIEYEDQTVYGIVAWSEQDRCGVRFAYSLQDGPLHIMLHQARMLRDMAKSPVSYRPHMPMRPRIASARSVAGGFGRRGIS